MEERLLEQTEAAAHYDDGLVLQNHGAALRFPAGDATQDAIEHTDLQGPDLQNLTMGFCVWPMTINTAFLSDAVEHRTCSTHKTCAAVTAIQIGARPGPGLQPAH